jgi:hypothetical protein
MMRGQAVLWSIEVCEPLQLSHGLSPQWDRSYVGTKQAVRCQHTTG